MHVSHLDAQALAASTLQEVTDARARAKAGMTRREKLGRLRQEATDDTQEPELAVEGTHREDEEPPEGEQPDSDGHALNAKA